MTIQLGMQSMQSLIIDYNTKYEVYNAIECIAKSYYLWVFSYKKIIDIFIYLYFWRQLRRGKCFMFIITKICKNIFFSTEFAGCCAQQSNECMDETVNELLMMYSCNSCQVRVTLALIGTNWCWQWHWCLCVCTVWVSMCAIPSTPMPSIN